MILYCSIRMKTLTRRGRKRGRGGEKRGRGRRKRAKTKKKSEEETGFEFRL